MVTSTNVNRLIYNFGVECVEIVNNWISTQVYFC